MAFHLCLSNSLEKLADEFYEKLCIPMNESNDPFAVIHTVVANGGMGTFLKRHLARQNKMGIAANIECSFLQKFISDEMGKFFPLAKREEFKRALSFWSPEVLSWRIDVLLEEEKNAFPDFTAYWSDAPMKRHLLGCELAQCFDRYQLYRSSCITAPRKMLEEWRMGKCASSQGILYKKLYDLTPDPDSFYAEFFNTPSPLLPLRERTGVFGIGTMPALYLACLKKLSEHCDITLFCPSPCQVYWGDSKSRKEILKELKNNSDPALSAEVLDDSVAQNQLLADLGVPGRDFFNLLLTEDCYTGEEESFYSDPAPDEKGSALQIFQSDILNARPRGESNAVLIPKEDASLRINCCPSSRRELEILHDQLLELFYGKSKKVDSDKFKVTDALRPEDVIVMFPDINKAAPLIDAVFSAGPFKGKYAICDRSCAGQSQVIECFSRLLELPKSRCTSEEILELFEFDCLSSKLGIKAEDLPSIVELASRFRISWGLDSKEHQNFRRNDFQEFSWQDGLDRFLTEYARGEDASVIYEKTDTGGVDGDKAEIFGIAGAFVSTLKEWRNELFKSRTPAEWGEFMFGWIQIFFSGGRKEYLPELSALRLAVAKIVRSAALADENKTVEPEVFISRLKSEYSLSGGKQHFLRDKITFCSLVPLRAVPAKVIAVLGLNDGEFPNTRTPKSFDLLKEIQRNDPNTANDGRYLFLEALMAAKEYLILSYVGFDDGQELAPAIPMVAVKTLLKNGFGIEKETVSLKSIEFEPLQSLLHQEAAAEKDSVSEVLPSAELPETMTLTELAEALTQNCEFFFKLRCGFNYNAKEKAELLTDDPESLTFRNESNLRRALWNMRLDGIEEEKWITAVEKARILPICGREFYDNAVSLLNDTVTHIEAVDPSVMEDFQAETALDCRQRLMIPLKNGKSHTAILTGHIALPANWQTKKRLTALRFSSCQPEKLMRFYLEHLLLSAAVSDDLAGLLIFSSIEKGKKSIRSCYLPPCPRENAVQTLTSLMSIALETFTADFPLPIFANASLAHAEVQCGYSNAVKGIRDKFIEKDLKRHNVIERFYTEDNYYGGRFDELAGMIYTPIASFKRRNK